MTLGDVRKLLYSLAFIAVYIAMDAASFIHPLHGLNITPWNPAPALGLVFVLRHGQYQRWHAYAALVLAVVLSEWLLRGIPDSWWASLVSALILTVGYVLLAEGCRYALRSAPLLDERAALFRWSVLITFGTLINSALYLGSLRMVGMLPADGWAGGVMRFWVGDAVGIAVLMPLLLWATSERGRFMLKLALLRWETAGYFLLALAVLGIAFDGEAGQDVKHFYFLFLPIVWAATRQGMAGAILAATILQTGTIIAVKLLDFSAVGIEELQILALVIALVGFFIGSVVDEQRRTSEELRQTLRLATAGEMAGALAHELNQPLTALGAYASACETLRARGESGERLDAAIKGMMYETARAGEVLRRLRDFFRTGATQLEVVSLEDSIRTAAQAFFDKARGASVIFELGPVPTLSLLADRLQLEIVLRNLLNNAFDAVVSGSSQDRRVHVSVEALPGNRVLITVEDSGKGLSHGEAARLFEPFKSTKSSGLGLGLLISRAIAETHGGTLWGEVADHGIFRLNLPVHSAPG